MLEAKLNGKLKYTSIFIFAIIYVFINQFIAPKLYELTMPNNFNLKLNILKIFSLVCCLILNALILKQRIYFKPIFDSKIKPILFYIIFLCVFFLGMLTQHFWYGLNIGILAALSEEYLFRGVLLSCVVKNINLNKVTYFRMWISILLPSLVFGLAHLTNWRYQGLDATLVQVIQVSGIGFLMGAIYFKTGSLIMPMLFHFIWDFNLSAHIGNVFSKSQVNTWTFIVAIIVMLFFIGIGTLIISKQSDKNYLLQKLLRDDYLLKRFVRKPLFSNRG